MKTLISLPENSLLFRLLLLAGGTLLFYLLGQLQSTPVSMLFI